MLVLNNFTNDIRVHKEAMSLASEGYKVNVIALWYPGLGVNEYHSGYNVIRLKLLSRPWQNRLLSPPIKHLEFALRVWQLAGHEPAQIYHAKDANTLPAAWLASKRNHAKLIYDSHELETGRNFPSNNVAGIYRKLWTLPEKIFIRQANSIITVSPSIANEISRIYHLPTPYVILNCPLLSPVQATARLRQEFNIHEKLYILLYQGTVSTGRGIEAFLNAVQLIKNVVGVVLGDGSALESYRNRVRSGEWERVYLPGAVLSVDLPLYTASADLGIALIQDNCLSHRLSLPNKLFEYLHAGLPVVCSDLPEMARVVRNYQVGEVVDPEDPSSIANGIQSILGDPVRYARMKANTKKAINDFNWQNESKKLIEIYESLALLK